MTDLIDGGDRVLALGRYSGSYNATGKAMNPQAVHVWSLKDGKALAFQPYIDNVLDVRNLHLSATLQPGMVTVQIIKMMTQMPA